MHVELTVQDSQLHAKWTTYLERYAMADVREAMWAYPDKKSVVLQFRDVERGDPELAEYLLQRPQHSLRTGAAAVFSLDVEIDPKPRLHLRVAGLPSALVLLPRQLRSAHLGRFVAVEGIVLAMSEARNFAAEAAFECKSCGNLVHLIQEEETLQEPVMCDACEKTGNIWRFRDDLSVHIDSQILIIQERPDQLRGGANPETRYLVCRDDLVHRVQAGEHIIANCIPHTKVRRVVGTQKSPEFDTILHAVSLERPGQDYADSEITDEQKARYEEIADNDPWATLVPSYAPHVHGMDLEKKAMIYALIGAPDRTSDGAAAVRGNIHVLLVGDPGIAKTQLILDMEKVAHRCTVATGTTTSGAGLGAAVTHDKTMGKWILEAGAAVLADDGVCAIDELGHMHPDDTKHLHTIMQEGVVRINKAVKATLRAVTTIIASMNPPAGERFDPYQDVASQIGLPGALLSRFDLVFCLPDRVDGDRDEEIALAVLGRRNGMAAKLHERLLDVDDFRRYVLYARTFNPHLLPEAVDLLKDYYRRLRQATKERPGITPRSVDGLARLTLAHARIHLRDEATAEDAQAAIDIMEMSLRSRGAIDETGRIDADVLVTGSSASQNDRMRLVLQVVKDIQRSHPKGYNVGWAREEEVLERAEGHGITQEQAAKCLETLKRNNSIYARGGGGKYAVLAS